MENLGLGPYHFVPDEALEIAGFLLMRPLTEEETRTFIEKLAKYIGRNASYLIDRTDEPHLFVLHKDRVYYVPEALHRRATNLPRDSLVALGTCFGKFTKTKKFRLHITCLDHLAQYACHRVWIKSTAEMSYLYGNHVLKAHVARMTDETPEHQGIVVCTAGEMPLGFAATAKPATMMASLEPTAILAFHQTDVGEYLRDEASLF